MIFFILVVLNIMHQCFSIIDVGTELNINSNLVIREAEFALQELSKLSDSLIYHTLTLSEIIAARRHDGLFHNNILLEMRLSSPYFKSNKPSEIFNMIVLEHKEDGIKTLAIDEFPEMKDLDVESFSINKIKAKRKEREEIFRRMEVQAHLQGVHPSQLDEEYFNNLRFPKNTSREDQLRSLDSDHVRIQRATLSEMYLQPRLSGIHLQQEQQLMTYTLVELNEIIEGRREGTAYQRYRAQTIIGGQLFQRRRWE